MVSSAKGGVAVGSTWISVVDLDLVVHGLVASQRGRGGSVTCEKNKQKILFFFSKGIEKKGQHVYRWQSSMLFNYFC